MSDAKGWKGGAGVDINDDLTARAVTVVDKLGRVIGTGEVPVVMLDVESRALLADIRRLLELTVAHLALLTDADLE